MGSIITLFLTLSLMPFVNDYRVVMLLKAVISWVTNRNPIDSASIYELIQTMYSQIVWLSVKRLA